MNGRWSHLDLAAYQARQAQFLQSGPHAPLVSVLTTTSDSGAHFVIPGEPIAKPRQTRSDKWKERPCVMKYREWADWARSIVGEQTRTGRLDVVAYLSIPSSYSKKKRERLIGQPHTVKPDADNVAKAVMDSLIQNDQCVHELRIKKRWDDGNGPRVEVTIY